VSIVRVSLSIREFGIQSMVGKGKQDRMGKQGMRIVRGFRSDERNMCLNKVCEISTYARKIEMPLKMNQSRAILVLWEQLQKNRAPITVRDRDKI
jgi:hypothetical protein